MSSIRIVSNGVGRETEIFTSDGHRLEGVTKVVIDPSQERLEREFDGVTRSHIPLHAVLRIDVRRDNAGVVDEQAAVTRCNLKFVSRHGITFRCTITLSSLPFLLYLFESSNLYY